MSNDVSEVHKALEMRSDLQSNGAGDQVDQVNRISEAMIDSPLLYYF